MEELRNAPQEKLSLPGILNYVRTPFPLTRPSQFLPLTRPFQTSTMSKVGGPRITDEIQYSARVDLNCALNKLIEPV